MRCREAAPNQPQRRQRSALSINRNTYLLAVFLPYPKLAERAFLECKAAELNDGEWLAVCTTNEEL